MLEKKLINYKVVLASKSPRRQSLLSELGIDFEVRTKENIEETWPAGLDEKKIPVYLAEKKANAFIQDLDDNELLITADTIVWLNNKVVNKPADFDDAFKIISELSGAKHSVITGVCVCTRKKSISFCAVTDVFFAKLTRDEIIHYINKYKPYDKAGAYGIQEWIGYIGIERIEGSYFNVVGLPVQRLYKELMNF